MKKLIVGMCTGLNYERFEVFRPGKPYLAFEVHVVRYAPSTMKVEAVFSSETLIFSILQCFIIEKTPTWFDQAPDRIDWKTSLLPVCLKQNILKVLGTAWECRVLGVIRVVKRRIAVLRT